jgi:hypothetical protein
MGNAVVFRKLWFLGLLVCSSAWGECVYTWSGSGYDEHPVLASCLNGVINVTFTTTTTEVGGLYSIDRTGATENQITIRLLAGSYLGRVQIRIQGNGDEVTYTPSNILNDGIEHTIETIADGSTVVVKIDGVQVNSDPWPHGLGDTSLPLIIGGHCQNCNGTANDVREILQSGSVVVTFAGDPPPPPVCPWDASILASDPLCVECPWVSGILESNPICVEPPPPPTYSRTLSWTNPTENTDGTPLDDLAGIYIYDADTEERAYTYLTTTPGATEQVTFETSSLCFKATAFDTSSNESVYSGTVCYVPTEDGKPYIL